MLRIVVLWCWVLVCSQAGAEDQIAGKKQYMETCAACHGDKGQGNDSLGSPALAGQQSAYLMRQLQNYSRGIRGEEDSFARQMVPMARLLQEDDAKKAVADYLNSLAPMPGQVAAKDLKNGYTYYQSACGACHGGQAEGNELLNAPRLAGLSADYLARQYQNFLAEKRGSHANDKFGRQMKMMAATLTDETMVSDVIAYITAQ